MTNSQSDIDELKTLQREAAELRAKRKRPRATNKPDASQQSETLEKQEATESPAESSASEEQTSAQKEKPPQSKRKRSRSKARPAAKKASATVQEQEGAKLPTQESVDEEQSPGADKVIHDYAVQIESVVKEMEDAAKERPVLALLAAFTIGIVIGQIFSRR